MGDGIDPDERKAFQEAQAGRIGEFLTSLGTDDDLLLRYVKDRAGVLREELEAERLIAEDVALLLEGDYCRISEVMSRSAPHVWVVSWVVGG